MTFQSEHGYFDDISRQNWVTWIISGVMALGLNLALFLAMPHLMDQAPSRPVMEDLLPQVNVIRLKKPDTEVKKKEVIPPKPPEVKPTIKTEAPSKRNIQTKTKLTLPFQVNPRLPNGPSTLTLPPMESAPLVTVTELTDTFTVGQLDAPLIVLANIPPMYPMRARRRGIQGWVSVKFLVDETGHVRNITILDAQPPGVFEESVQRCVGGWKFKPGTVSGIPVKTWVERTLRFELE